MEWVEGVQLVWFSLTWFRLNSFDSTRSHLGQLYFKWFHLVWLEFIWFYLVEFGFTLFHLALIVSLNFIWFILVPLDVTGFQIMSFVFTWFDLYGAERSWVLADPWYYFVTVLKGCCSHCFQRQSLCPSSAQLCTHQFASVTNKHRWRTTICGAVTNNSSCPTTYRKLWIR